MNGLAKGGLARLQLFSFEWLKQNVVPAGTSGIRYNMILRFGQAGEKLSDSSFFPPPRFCLPECIAEKMRLVESDFP